jgi:VIT1/CCC1 family predicted Fe2+/Mn2+ transporter
MLVFINLLTDGRCNKMIIARVKSSDKNSTSEIIKMELDNTIIGRCDEETRRQIVEMALKCLSSISQDALEKPRISRDHFITALICIFFVSLPSIVISPFFLLISDLNSAILVSNIIGLGMLFAFGYKLGSCTGRNKIITGIIMLIGLAIIVAAIVFST